MRRRFDRVGLRRCNFVGGEIKLTFSGIKLGGM